MKTIASAVVVMLLVSFRVLLPAETNADHNKSWAQLSGTATDIRFEQLARGDGIPSEFFYQVVQDGRGFLWFSTQNGLIRYDGYQHVRYPGLPMVRRMAEVDPGLLFLDRSGTLWVGTDVLTRFDPATGAFVPVLKPQTVREGLEREAITAIVDGPDGTLWLAVWGLVREGDFFRQRSEPILYQVDPARRTATAHRMGDEITKGRPVAIRSILEGPGGRLWLGTSAGLVSFDLSAHTFQHYPHTHPNSEIEGVQRSFNALAWDKTGHLWIHMPAGIERFDPGTGRFDRFVEATFYEMTSDPSGRLWLWGGPHGLRVFDPAKPPESALRTVSLMGAQRRILGQTARIRGLGADRQGNVWVSPPAGSPFHRYSPLRAKFGSYLPDPSDPNSLSGGDISGFAEDSDGSMWISSNYAGLNRFDPQTNTFTHFRHAPGKPDSIPDDINTIYMDRSGTLWIGGQDGSIGRFERRTGRYTPLTKLPLRITSMLEDSTGRFWVGTMSRPVQLVDRRTGAVTPTNIGGGYLTHEDRSGNLWFGFAPGLNRLDSGGNVRLIPIAKPEGRGQTALSPHSLREDSEGVFWMTTSRGLYQFDPRTEKSEHYGKDQGLPTDVVRCMLPDATGNLWMVNAEGLSRFDLREKRFYNYDESDGLQGRNFALYACHAARDGRLYFGGIDGFNAFYPRDVLERPAEPALVLSGLEVNGKDLPVPSQDAVRLAHSQNNLTFQFVTPNPINPERIRYRFRLDGLEEGWAEGKHREARYTDLAPGSYVFRAEASADGRTWSGNGAALQFSILPPWWRTWWAESLGLLAVAGLLFEAYHLRVRALHKRERSLAALVDQRTAELVEARAQAQATEQLLTIANCIPDVLWTMDLSGRFTYASARVEQTHGWTAEQMLTLTFRDTTTPAQAIRIEKRVKEELLRASSSDYDRHSLIILESEEMRRDGTTFWAEVHATLLWSKGSPAGFIGVTRDITERRRQQKEGENLQNQLAHAQKMELVGRLAGGIAHDFNNLMGVIVMYADSALEELPPNESATDALNAIRDASEKAVSLGRQLMAFSSKQLFQTEILNLNAVIADNLKMMRRLIGEDVNVVFHPFQGLNPVKADRGQLGQVLMNLAVNSRDAMPEGGTFTIETNSIDVDERDAQTYPDVKPGSYTMLTVRDTGIGMDKETVGRIFEPFFTTKAVGKGTGLGLSVVYGIVKQSKGFIGVRSEPGHGTEFKIYLPTAPEAPKSILDAEVGPIEGGSETVLLVEDEPVLRDKISRILGTAGYEVLTATDGHMAVDLGISDRPIHLLLTDIVMPELSGVRLAERLMSFRPNLKVLYMSGYPEAGNGSLSDTNFLPKPFTKGKLLRRVRDVLG